MLEMNFDTSAQVKPGHTARDGKSSCPFCGEYCHVTGSHERVHYFLVEVKEGDTSKGNGDDLVSHGHAPDRYEYAEEITKEDYSKPQMRTSSILRLRTKPRYPWRVSQEDICELPDTNGRQSL